jgi:hypothetical protein
MYKPWPYFLIIKAGRIAASTCVHVGKNILSRPIVHQWWQSHPCAVCVDVSRRCFFSHQLMRLQSRLTPPPKSHLPPRAPAAFGHRYAAPALQSSRQAHFLPRSPPPHPLSTQFRLPLLGFVVLGFRACDRLPKKAKLECPPSPATALPPSNAATVSSPKVHPPCPAKWRGLMPLRVPLLPSSIDNTS